MANVIITGSTRGIGLGLATEFLVRGHAVMISGRAAGRLAMSLVKKRHVIEEAMARLDQPNPLNETGKDRK